jgi:hypothetical protein
MQSAAMVGVIICAAIIATLAAKIAWHIFPETISMLDRLRQSSSEIWLQQLHFALAAFAFTACLVVVGLLMLIDKLRLP